jgi:subtilisin family serine protease
MRSRIRLVVLLAVAVATVVATLASAGTPVVPNDPLFPAEKASSSHPARLGQWGLRQIEVQEAWARTRGGGVVIAVVDSGVDLDHPDLQKNLLPGATFPCTPARMPCDGRWLPSDDPQAVPDHGTHVSGIAAAIANNGIGIAGVAPGARILPVNVFQDSGAVDTDIAAGITWAADHGAHVINLSLGYPVPVFGLIDEPTDPIPAAIAYAIKKGIVVVVAAGNATWPLCESPSDVDGVLCVAASDTAGNPAEYSSLPNKDDQLAVRAPGGGTLDYQRSCGGGIVSTVPEGFGNDVLSGENVCFGDHANSKGTYAEMIGTSMSAPHVAGVVALVRSMGCNAAKTIEIVTRTAHNPRTPRGYDPVYGWGIVNAKDAVAAAAQQCPAPR